MREEKRFITVRGEVLAVDKAAGTVEALIPMSTGSMDRMNEVILPSAFKKTLKQFMKHPVLVSSHDYWDLTKQIGQFDHLEVTDDGLMGRPRWYVGMGNQEADWGFKLAEMRMAAFSVGFIPIKWSKIDPEKDDFWGNRQYEEVELLEISQVVVPANRDAIQSLKAKSIHERVRAELAEEMEKRVFALGEIPEAVTVATEDKSETPSDPPEPQPVVEARAKDVVTKPEETDDYIRIPNPKDDNDHTKDCEVRTINISAEEGIKALYCLTHKSVMTYLFAKDKGWTMAKAEEWVKEHAKNITSLLHDGKVDKGQPEAEQGQVETVKGAISYASAHPKGTSKAPEDEDWDAGAEVKAAEVDDLKVMCAYVDSEAGADKKSSYKLPHHKAKGHALVWKAVSAAGAAIMGARGGVDIPDSAMPGVKAHLGKHYAEFDKEPPWTKKDGMSQQELLDEMAYLEDAISTTGISDEAHDAAMSLVSGILKQTPTGRDIPDDILAKAGAVLSAANKRDIEQAIQLLTAVLDRSSKEEQEGYQPAKDDILAMVEQVRAEFKQRAEDEKARTMAMVKECVSETLDELRGKVH